MLRRKRINKYIYQYIHQVALLDYLVLHFSFRFENNLITVFKLKRIYLPNILTLDKLNFFKKNNNNFFIGSAAEKRIIKITNLIDSALTLKKINIETELFDFSELSLFEKNVLFKLLKNVPAGKTIAYSKLGELCGYSKNSARAIGNVMAKNPFPVIFPCHRVIKADGSIGNFQGAPEFKKKLLAFENYLETL